MPSGSRPGEHRGGRTKGTRNKRTVDGETYARAILEDDKVRKRFLLDCQRGKLPYPVVLHLLQLAYGTPKELTSHAIDRVNGHAAGTQASPTETLYRLVPG